MTKKSYRRLIQIPTFHGRYEYLRIGGAPGEDTFGFERYVNQRLYHSAEWKATREKILIRDADQDGPCDLAIAGRPIAYKPIIHHINPITLEDIEAGRYCVFDPNNLITVTHETHNAIHYGDASSLPIIEVPRTKGDTVLWKTE